MEKEWKVGDRATFNSKRFGIIYDLHGRIKNIYTDIKDRKVALVLLDEQFNGVQVKGVYCENLKEEDFEMVPLRIQLKEALEKLDKGEIIE